MTSKSSGMCSLTKVLVGSTKSATSLLTSGSGLSDSSSDKCENMSEMFEIGESSLSNEEELDSYDVSANDRSKFDKPRDEAAPPARVGSLSNEDELDSYDVSANDRSKLDTLSDEAAPPASTDSEVIVNDELVPFSDAADMS